MASVIGDGDVMKDWAANYSRHHRHRLAYDLRMICRTVEPARRVLEFGSSPPFLTLALKRAGYDVIGLDIALERFSRTIAQHGLDIRAVNFESQPVPLGDGAIDAVVFNEVFEHLRINLIATMREVHRVLRVGGTLMLSTPNMRSLRGLWTLLARGTTCHIGPDLYEEYDKLRRFGHMGHVREYTPSEVARFLTRVGFSVQRIEYRNTGPPIRTAWSVRVQGTIERTICRIAPSLSPLFSVVCQKTDDQPKSSTDRTNQPTT